MGREITDKLVLGMYLIQFDICKAFKVKHVRFSARDLKHIPIKVAYDHFASCKQHIDALAMVLERYTIDSLEDYRKAGLAKEKPVFKEIETRKKALNRLWEDFSAIRKEAYGTAKEKSENPA